MLNTVHKTSIHYLRKLTSSVILMSFVSSLITVPVGAQSLALSGTPVGLTTGFQPPVLLGLKIHPENPLLFDFIVDQGASKLSEDELSLETEKLVKYFLAALTIPDKDVWVNLSPYEKDRIIPDALGQTVMGKTMLEQDYLLKQLASSLTNPEEKQGEVFWSKVKTEVQKKFGNTDVPMNTFNKVWIVPQSAEVLESHGIVMVGAKRLKVMMDQDYLAFEKNAEPLRTLVVEKIQQKSDQAKDVNIISSGIFKSTILPDIEKEINEGKNFADVRQIYNSVILAAWYKQALKESLLGKVYADKSKVVGVETDDKDMKQRIYEQYLSAFKKGVYNLIKEESDSAGDMIPRKYFSGGMKIATFVGSSALVVQRGSSAVMERNLRLKTSQISTVTVRLMEDEGEAGVASSSLKDLPKELKAGAPLDLSKLVLVEDAVVKNSFYRIYRNPAEPGIEYYVANDDRYQIEFFNNDLRMHGLLAEAPRLDGVTTKLLEYGKVKSSRFKFWGRTPYFKVQGLANEQNLNDSELWDLMTFDEQLDVLIRLAESYAQIYDAGIFYNGAQLRNVSINQDQSGKFNILIKNFANSQLRLEAAVPPEFAGRFITVAEIDIENFEKLVILRLTKMMGEDNGSLWLQIAGMIGLGVFLDHLMEKTKVRDSFQDMHQVADYLRTVKDNLEELQRNKIVSKQDSVFEIIERIKTASSTATNPDGGEVNKAIAKLVPDVDPKALEFVATLGNGGSSNMDQPDTNSNEQLKAVLARLDIIRAKASEGEKPLIDLNHLTSVIMQRIWDNYILSTPENAEPISDIAVYYYTTPSAPSLSDLELEATRVVLEYLGFKRDKNKEIESAYPGFGANREIYGFPRIGKLEGAELEWANYDDLSIALFQRYSVVMPGRVSSSPLEDYQIAMSEAEVVLKNFARQEVTHLEEYERRTMARGIPLKSIRDNNLVANVMAIRFVTLVILEMVKTEITQFESLEKRQWVEIEDAWGGRPERLEAPGDFINQLAIVSSESRSDEAISEKIFHPEFIALVNQAAAQVAEFKRESAQYRAPQTAPKASSAILERIRQLGLRQEEIITLNTGRIIMYHDRQGRPYTFVHVGERPGYKKVVPKFGLLAGDFRRVPISSLDKMLQLQLPWLEDKNNKIEFIGRDKFPDIVNDQDGQLVGALQSGTLKLPASGAFNMGTVIVFANRDAILVPGSSLLTENHKNKITKIKMLQSAATSKVIALDNNEVTVRYLGLVKVGEQWRDLTQFIAVSQDPVSKKPLFVGVVYLEGNQANTEFQTWDEMKALGVDVGLKLSASSSAEESQVAMVVPTHISAKDENLGGISFDATNMNLQIKRDGEGVPLPLPQQNLDQINIQGFFPVIINIQPVNSKTIPLLLGQSETNEKLSFLN